MIPTGYEYNFLSDKTVKVVLGALLEELKLLWGHVYVEVSPDWEVFNFENWLSCIDVLPTNLELYFASDKAGFEHIEENGVTPNKTGIQFFLLEINVENPVGYKANILGNIAQYNANFGEFSCELLSAVMTRFAIIVPEESKGDGDDLVCMFRGVLQG